MHRTSIPSIQPQQPAQLQGGKPGPVLGMHSPSVAKSLNFVAASRMKGSPKTRTSDVGAGSPISKHTGQRRVSAGNNDVDYSQFSPSLKGRTSSPISPNNNGRERSGTPGSSAGPTEYGMGVGVRSSSSPLAAFRARHSTGGRSSPSPSSLRTRSMTPSTSSLSNTAGEADLSIEALGLDEDGAGESFLGDESYEVDRALRSLRTSLGGVSSTPAPFR